MAKSPYKDNTLIFVIEDDAQNGGDHVDAHRSIAYIVGPYVKQGALVSTHYTTVSLVRTIEEVLGLEPLGINDGLTAPMADVFDTKQTQKQKPWDYQAVVAGILCDTELNDIGNDLPQCQDKALIAASPTSCHSVPVRDAAYWTAAMQGQDFSIEDRLDEEAFNRALWAGLKGEQVPYPNVRHGHDLKEGRAALLKAHFKQLARECDHKDAVASAK